MTRNGLKPPVLAASAAMLATVVAAGTGAVTRTLAQTPQSLGTPSSPLGVPEAPVGHRQPRPSDLPPSIQRDEQNNVPAQVGGPQRGTAEREKSTFGQLPTICVRC